MIGRFQTRRLLFLLIAATLASFAVGSHAARRRPRVSSPSQTSVKRLALIIGNNAYETAPLKNPVNDARAVAKALRESEFVVTAKENLTLNEMKMVMRDFGEQLRAAGRESVGLFYYAGHGVQVQDKNFLIPVDAKITSENDVEFEAVDVGFVIAKMDAAQNSMNIVILDACRDNPFARSFRSMSRGLALMNAPTGILIAYATAPGSTAGDGEGANGLYTEELLTAMRKPGMPVENVFKQVRIKVRERSNGKQVPWESSSLVGNFYFTPPPGVTPTPTPTPRPGVDDPALELAFWDAIKNSTDPQDYKDYLEQYPNGRFALLAKRRAGLAPSVSPTPTPTPKPTSTPDGTRSETKPRTGTGSLAATATNKFGIALVLVRPGSFLMGSTNGDANEQPVHRVNIAAPFYLGKYEVTQAQWTAVMGSNPSENKGAENPVEQVSWDDVQEFIRKLNALGDGFEYRLPTEAEWEYACRAETTGDFAGDLDASGWYESNSKGSTHPVGQKQSNAFGLYDMHGNVWEWCADRSPETYQGAPVDGSAWIDLRSQKRILRGGSWDHDANHSRSAYRHWFTPSRHTHGIGFRIAAVPRT
jgi:formylglycine-generating enzyme required for sulfatase activity